MLWQFLTVHIIEGTPIGAELKKLCKLMNLMSSPPLTLSLFLRLSFWLFIFLHSALSEEEKTLLRAGLITNFNEPVNQVSKREWHVGD